MADAWSILFENSSLTSGDAWTHLNAQEGGGGVCPAPGPTTSQLIQSCNRAYTTRRVAIANALTEKLKLINGVFPFVADLEGRAFSTSKFLDDVQAFPEVHLETGYETRTYQGAGFKDRFLPITVRCYVHDEDDSVALGLLLEDIETVLEDNANLAYYDRDLVKHTTYNISVISITTNESSSPTLVGEVTCEVRY